MNLVSNSSLLTSKWAFKKTEVKHSATSLVKGFTQKQDVDNREIFSSIVRYSTQKYYLL